MQQAPYRPTSHDHPITPDLCGGPTPLPTSLPTSHPTPLPSSLPTTLPTSRPTPLSTSLPTPVPTPVPTPAPSAEACINDMKDGEESDTNCRSSYYPPCALGGACNLVGDCQMGLCSVDSTPVYVSQPTPVSSPQPTPIPSPLPTSLPTSHPTRVPTSQPIALPTRLPTSLPTPVPTPLPTTPWYKKYIVLEGRANIFSAAVARVTHAQYVWRSWAYAALSIAYMLFFSYYIFLYDAFFRDNEMVTYLTPDRTVTLILILTK